MVQSIEGVLAVLVAVCALFFWLEKRTGWRLFTYFPPLLFIYATPVVLNNVGVLPPASPVYDALRQLALPAFIALMLLSVDVGAAVRVMGRGVLVMLLGTLGVIVGGAFGYFVVHRWLDPLAWKAFGALAGSWIGGTANMAAIAGALETPPELFGLAVLADNVVYVVWLPILLGSKAFAERFNRWARVSEGQLDRMDAAAAGEVREVRPPVMRDYLFLGCLALAVTWAAARLGPLLPVVDPILSTST